jgi:hypothetical protein
MIFCSSYLHTDRKIIYPHPHELWKIDGFMENITRMKKVLYIGRVKKRESKKPATPTFSQSGLECFALTEWIELLYISWWHSCVVVEPLYTHQFSHRSTFLFIFHLSACQFDKCSRNLNWNYSNQGPPMLLFNSSLNQLSVGQVWTEHEAKAWTWRGICSRKNIKWGKRLIVRSAKWIVFSNKESYR